MKLKTITGEIIIVDKEDYKRVNQHEWRVAAVTEHAYMKKSWIENGKSKTSLPSLHYWLLDYPIDPNSSNGKAQVKHKNGNKLDNRRSNLEIIKKKPPVELKCEYCENLYMASQMNIKNRKYCSEKCAKPARAKAEIEKRKIAAAKSTNLPTKFRPAIKPRGGLCILDRDGFRCALCGKSSYEDLSRLHVDHIMPYSRGGRDCADNLITLCERCNLEKSDFLLEEKNIDNLQTEARKRNVEFGISDNLRIPNNRNYKKR